MATKRYIVELNAEERQELLDFVKEGPGNKRQTTRALILLRADEGMKDAAIVAALGVACATVERTRKRFVEGNVAGALSEVLRQGKRTITGREEAPWLVAKRHLARQMEFTSVSG